MTGESRTDHVGTISSLDNARLAQARLGCHSLYGRVFVKRRERCSEHFLYSLSAPVA
jgi:hypothetical protein